MQMCSECCPSHEVKVHVGTDFIEMILGMQHTAAALQRNQQRFRLDRLKEGATVHSSASHMVSSYMEGRQMRPNQRIVRWNQTETSEDLSVELQKNKTTTAFQSVLQTGRK